MTGRLHIQAISCPLTPLEALERWPRDCPVMLLHSGRPDDRWARWSILAVPRDVFRHDGRSHWSGGADSRFDGVSLTDDPLSDADRLFESSRLHIDGPATLPPFVGGWIGYLSYDLGRVIEPTACARGGATDDRGWPLIELAWCPDALVFSHADAQWWSVGNAAALVDQLDLHAHTHDDCRFGSVESTWRRREHEAAVERAIEHIAAGDIFQANITGRQSCRMTGTPRALAVRALAAAESWYGALLEFGDRALLSLSPELFLDFTSSSRLVVTRPMKGTRPIETDPAELADSAKDAAELAMIVDLMRNDLGRICEFGSVRVAQPREIERHPTVWQAVAEIEGRVRTGISIGDILAATFPPGSVTGAPKIRAMQIIDELEPVQRGPYCGAMGHFSRCGSFQLNVGIRTLALTRQSASDEWLIDYSAGGGIVADSVPSAEFEEAMTKAAIFRRVIAASGSRQVGIAGAVV